LQTAAEIIPKPSLQLSVSNHLSICAQYYTNFHSSFSHHTFCSNGYPALVSMLFLADE